MIEVKITVEIPGLPEALNALAAAMQGNAPRPTAEGPGSEAPKTVTYTNPPAAPAETAADATHAGTQNAPAAATAAPTHSASPSEAPAITVDDLGRAGASLIDAGKMPQLIALLGKYGVQAITQLQPAAFPAFAEELKALGAKF